jgi:hypothetical protein
MLLCMTSSGRVQVQTARTPGSTSIARVQPGHSSQVLLPAHTYAISTRQARQHHPACRHVNNCCVPGCTQLYDQGQHAFASLAASSGKPSHHLPASLPKHQHQGCSFLLLACLPKGTPSALCLLPSLGTEWRVRKRSCMPAADDCIRNLHGKAV